MVAPQPDLKTFPAFLGLNDFERMAFVSACRRQEFVEDTDLITEGGAIDCVYFVYEGGLRIHTDAGGTDQELALVAAPCVVGELELFVTETRAPASVTAIEPVKALVMPYAAFKQRLGDGDLAAFKIVHNFAKVLAARLHATDRRMSEVAIRSR